MSNFRRIGRGTSVLLAVACASMASAAPFSQNVKYATHRTRELSSGAKIQIYHPPSTYQVRMNQPLASTAFLTYSYRNKHHVQTFGEGVDHPLLKRDDVTAEESALAFVESRTKVDPDAVHVDSSLEGDTSKHVYLKQQANGITLANAVANVAFNQDGKVVAFGSSFVEPSMVASPVPTVTVEDAIATAEKELDGTFDSANLPAPELQYLAKDDGSVVLTHSFQVRNVEAGTWFQAYVDAHSGELVSVTDYVSNASVSIPICPFRA